MKEVRIFSLVFAVLLSSQVATADEVILNPIKDNTLFENATGALSNGAGAYLFAGNTNGGATRRGLLVFDVAGNIPAGSVINSVSLTLNMSKTIAGAQTVELRRVLTDWGEGTSDAEGNAGNEGSGAASTAGDASWLHTFFDSATWAAPGGDFAAAASASLEVGGLGSYTWESTPELVTDVQAWYENQESNFGWILLGNEAGNGTAKRFDSRGNGDASLHPQLQIEYMKMTAVEGQTWGQVKREAK